MTPIRPLRWTLRFLLVTGLIASTLVSPATSQDRKLRFGVGPLQPTPTETKKAYEPFFAYIAKTLDRDFDQPRVAIARALAQEAAVILAAEPMASLDPESAASALETLRSVVRAGVAVIASLHQVRLATTCADRAVALRDRRVLQDAPAAEIDARAIEQIHARGGEAS